MKKMIIMTISVACSVVASANLNLPTNEEISRMCAYTNSPVAIQYFVVSFWTNILWKSEFYTKSEIERVQTCLYSNMISYTKSNDLIPSISETSLNSFIFKISSYVIPKEDITSIS